MKTLAKYGGGFFDAAPNSSEPPDPAGFSAPPLVYPQPLIAVFGI